MNNVTTTVDHSFNYLCLYTSYLYELSSVREGDKLLTPIKSFSGRPSYYCFYNLFRNLSNNFKNDQKINISLGIYMNADFSYFDKFRKNNLVVVNKDTVIRHIELAKKFFDFNYQLTKRKNYYLRIQMIGNSLQIKFLCAWIRYLYEFPANVLMNDLYRLIDAGKFTEESIFNLIMMLNSTLKYNHIRGDQCIKIWGKFQTDEELKKKLDYGGDYLSNLYTDIIGTHKDRLNSSSTEESSYNYWMDLDKLADRYLVYEKALNSYKNLK